MTIPRPEHPKPQMERTSWRNLNGSWDFEIDNNKSGFYRGLAEETAVLKDKIVVPFCPESRLSGVGHTDYIYSVWYQRHISLTEEECAQRIFLNFGAVDYESEVYVNGKLAGTHKGGYTSFGHEITKLVRAGDNVITVHAKDETVNPMIPSGKQSMGFASSGCFYTRVTGIWQTVWLEFTPQERIKSVKFDGNPAESSVTITTTLEGTADLTAQVYYEGKPVGSAVLKNAGGRVSQTVALSEVHLWEPGAGRLYDVELQYGADHVKSYFGLRTLRLDGVRFLINEKSVFQRLILDQGFYPDGIYTAPTEADLEKDIDLSLAMGFNGPRLHENVFEERYLYHCDKKGYIVWGEYPNWGLDVSNPNAIYSILPEWLEELERDYSHPSIVGWAPFNETWDRNGHKQYDDVLRMVYRTTKAVDPSRPCIDTSGNFHVETDIFDVHDYDQDPVTFREHYDLLMKTGELYDWFSDMKRLSNQYAGSQFAGRQKFTGGPTFVSEYGGIQWSMDEKGWGYGNAPANPEEFRARFQGLTDALLDNDQMFGLCYTQLTDVEQEQNGLYTYTRQPKFDPAWVKSVMSRKAAIED